MAKERYVLRLVEDEDDDDAGNGLTELQMLRMLAEKCGYRVVKSGHRKPIMPLRRAPTARRVTYT